MSEEPSANPRAQAIGAHLHGLDVEVVTHVLPRDDATRLEDRLAHAQALVEEEQAVGIFWVDASVAGVFDLYLVRPDRRELLRRRVAYDPLAQEAGLESLGVVTRSITSALTSDSPVDMEVVVLEPREEPPPPDLPTPEPAPPPAARQRGRAVIGLGYVGTSYAAEIPWQSGLGLSAGWAWPFGLHVGAGYTIYQVARADRQAVRIDVERHPVDLVAGYTYPWKNLRISGEVAVILDYSVRRARSTEPGLAALDDRGRMLVALGPRARLGVVAVWRLELFAALGIEAWLNDVEYGVQTSASQTEVLLRPHRARAWISAGVAARI